MFVIYFLAEKTNIFTILDTDENDEHTQRGTNHATLYYLDTDLEDEIRRQLVAQEIANENTQR